MSITTRTGDNGETGLLFSKRTSRAIQDRRLRDIDELNAAIGLAERTYKARVKIPGLRRSRNH